MSKTTTKANASDLAKEFYENLGILAGPPPLVKKMIEEAIDLDLPLGIFGPAGIGKTQLVRQVAKEKEMDLHVLYLAHMDKEDIAGFPFPDPEDNRRVVMRLRELLPLKKSKKKGTVLFLDEWNRGDRPVVNAIFTMMEHPRRVSDYELPDDVRVILGGNNSGGQYSVNEAEQEPAIRRRVIWVGMLPSVPAFLEHAHKAGFHLAVINYIRQNKEALYDIEAHNAGRIAACPASWEKVSNVIKHFEAKYGDNESKEFQQQELVLRSLLQGIINRHQATEFMTHLMNEDGLAVDPEQVITDFSEETEAYKRVQKMVKGRNRGASGAIGRLCSAVALTLAAHKPSALLAAPNVAKFMSQLDSDCFQKFVKELVDTLKQQDDTEQTYTTLFNKALGQQEVYLETRRRHTSQMASIDAKKQKGDLEAAKK